MTRAIDPAMRDRIAALFAHPDRVVIEYDTDNRLVVAVHDDAVEYAFDLADERFID